MSTPLRQLLELGPTSVARGLAAGAEPQTNLEDELRATIARTRDNLPLVDGCIAKHADREQLVGHGSR
jgi:hypothetical protein